MRKTYAVWITKRDGMGQIIKDASVFTYRYVPELIMHREKEIKDLSLRMNKPLSGDPVKSTAIFGLSGTGKTLVSKHLAEQLVRECPDVKVCYVRLKETQSEWKGLHKITHVLMNTELYGRSTSAIYSKIYGYIKQLDEKYIIFILDEIDSITDRLDSFLDAFLRPYENFNLGEKEVSVIFITNNMNFPENISVGTRSSWNCIDKLYFEKYDAVQLNSILMDRAKKGLHEGAYVNDAIPLCAAYAFQEHGDARQAIEFLGKAAQIAENEGAHQIEDKHVKQARELIEFEGVAQSIKSLSSQAKALALALVLDIIDKSRHPVRSQSYLDNLPTTLSVYIIYKDIALALGIEVLTPRRVHDFLVEFESLGLINSQVVSKGRMGRSRRVELIVPSLTIARVVTDDFRFKGYKWVQDELEKKDRTRAQTKLSEPIWKPGEETQEK